jgi:hypothetical protein
MISNRFPGQFGLLPLAAAVTVALFAPSSANAISSRTLFAPTGAVAGDLFGRSVAPAGDVNGDGFDDVIVGAYSNDAAGVNAGRAYVYFGGPAADAVADLTLTGAAAGDNFGISVASAGDFNRDGFADVIVGAYLNDAAGADAGRAYVYFGGLAADATADLILTGAAAADNFGVSVATAGDVNADGFDDVIVGADGNDTGGADAGRAYVFYGGLAPDAFADLTLTGVAAGDRFGHSVASAGDVNGNGAADLIVGAYSSDTGGFDAGSAYVFYGGNASSFIPSITLTGAAASDFFGRSVASAGDVNGDGFGDVIVGAPENDAGGTNAGRAYVYFGGPADDPTADLILTAVTPDDDFGFSVARAGDVNADGYGDVIVGDYSNGGLTGRAFVYFGGPAANSTADLILTGVGGGDYYGFSVASAGDVDGDGYSDVVVGAIFNDAGGSDAGRAYVTSVYPYRVLAPNGGEQWVAGEPVTVRWLGHDVADLAVSFDSGANWSTRAVGVGGQAENEYTFTAPGAATSLAKVRLSYSGQTVSRATSDESDSVFRIVLGATPPATAHRLQLTPTGGRDVGQLRQLGGPGRGRQR